MQFQKSNDYSAANWPHAELRRKERLLGSEYVTRNKTYAYRRLTVASLLPLFKPAIKFQPNAALQCLFIHGLHGPAITVFCHHAIYR